MTVNLLSDRELLELAAKAVGLKHHVWCGVGLRDQSVHAASHCGWNPLQDDGDAFRLAVKLNMFVRCGEFGGVESPVTAEGDGHDIAATRRAIVRAAAEIGGRAAI